MQEKTESFCDPDFEPTDQQWQQVAEDVSLVSKWRRAMADKGIKVLTLDIPYDEQMQKAKLWAEQQNKFG